MQHISTNLNSLKDSISKSIFGTSLSEAKERGICIQCKEPALAKCYSPCGIREYQISGMCEQCFDSLFAEGDDND